MSDARTRTVERDVHAHPSTLRALARRRGEPCYDCGGAIHVGGDETGCDWTCARAILRRAVDNGETPCVDRHSLLRCLERALADAMNHPRHPRTSMAAANAQAEVEGAKAVRRPERLQSGWHATGLAGYLVAALQEPSREGEVMGEVDLCRAVLACVDAAAAPEDMEECDGFNCGQDEGHEGPCHDEHPDREEPDA